MIGAWDLPAVRASRRLMRPSTMTHGWPTSRFCRMTSGQPRRGISCTRWLGSMARASAARGCCPNNSSAYVSKTGREACSTLGLTTKRTRPYTSRTNGKVKRFINTLQVERAYSMAFPTSWARNRWLPRYLTIYNCRRCHMTLAGRSTIQQNGMLQTTE